MGDFKKARFLRLCLLLTSNLPFSKWDSIFKDEMTTNAAIDRLIHHARGFHETSCSLSKQSSARLHLTAQ
ncbi:MAG: ATP-binding protein [Gammaproteobacteria bacterium]|nr:ATP-binding protein [Gammaproteobacteria bacterium]